MNVDKVIDAIVSLRPGATLIINGESFDSVTLLNGVMPTEKEVNDEISRLQSKYDSTKYQRQRATEYPPITDYLDGVVKGDQAQIDAYIAACQAVKAKYLKP